MWVVGIPHDCETFRSERSFTHGAVATKSNDSTFHHLKLGNTRFLQKIHINQENARRPNQGHWIWSMAFFSTVPNTSKTYVFEMNSIQKKVLITNVKSWNAKEIVSSLCNGCALYGRFENKNVRNVYKVQQNRPILLRFCKPDSQAQVFIFLH
jgi:hypothetical protein